MIGSLVIEIIFAESFEWKATLQARGCSGVPNVTMAFLSLEVVGMVSNEKSVSYLHHIAVQQ